MTSSAERAEAKMIAGEMISSQESQIRIYLGYSLLAGFAAFNFYCPVSPEKQSFFGSMIADAGALLYLMGRDSQ
jgi:hypothetical protein